MLQNKNEESEEMDSSDDSEPITFLATKAVCRGRLAFKNTLCIDGEFEGKLTTSDKLIVAEQGAVLGEIEAGTVICKGKIRGNIIASQKVEIHSTGKILGDVLTPALMIELGAMFNGKSYMSDSVTELTPPPTQKQSSKDDPQIKLFII